MKKKHFIILVILLVAVSLFLLALPALARGGGGLGGELGGEGSLGGEFGGGGLGGFSFFPLFMGGGFGSSGFLFGIVIFILLISFMRRGTVRYSNRYSNYRGTAPPMVMEPNNLDAERIFAKSIDYTRKNMLNYAAVFPHWDGTLLTGRVKQVFFVLQDAWARQDLSGCRDYLVPGIYSSYEEKLDQMRMRGERNVLKDIRLLDKDINFIYSQVTEEKQRFIVMIFASMFDYVVNAGGEIISGSSGKKLYFKEFWEFVWQDDLWKLSQIHQEDSVVVMRIKNMDLDSLT